MSCKLILSERHLKRIVNDFLFESCDKDKDVKIYVCHDPKWFAACFVDLEEKWWRDIPESLVSVCDIVEFETERKRETEKAKNKIMGLKSALSCPKESELVPPILIRKSGELYDQPYQVMDGHHRFWASQDLNKEKIKARIVPDHMIKNVFNIIDLPSDPRYQK